MALIRYRPAPGALDEPFARSRRGITCDRCGKDRMLNETHTPQGGMHRAGWILLTGIVAGTCGTTATARAAKIYGNWVESARSASSSPYRKTVDRSLCSGLETRLR